MYKVLVTFLLLSVAVAQASKSEYPMVNETAQFDLLFDSSLTVQSFGNSSIFLDRPRAYDPINNESYEEVIVGPVQKKKFFQVGNYTHFRYVTVYNIEKKKERVAYLPSFEEDCHDNSFFMASWGESRTLTVSLKSDVGAKALGLSASVSASISQGITFSTSRRIKSTLDIRADHIPFKVSERHFGVTYIQTYNQKTKSYGFLRGRGYPAPFQLDNQNIGMKVERKILERCTEN